MPLYEASAAKAVCAASEPGPVSTQNAWKALRGPGFGQTAKISDGAMAAFSSRK